MPQARSLHIGLNFVDPSAYDGWDGQLAGCINDANSMEAICSGRGFQTSKLIDSQATSHEVVRCIGQAAQALCAGDAFVLTYSGHGSQVDDVDGDESEAQDETWVLWDRMLVDDELHSLWCQFKPGVRIFLLSDSCHSGTVARMRGYDQMVLEREASTTAVKRSRGERDAAPARPKKYRLMPPGVAQRVAEASRGAYDSVQWVAGAKTRDVGATVILISGCQDNQLSADGDQNGLFTQTLLEVWDGGGFEGNYKAFWRAIQQRMPADQTPNYYLVGAPHAGFEAETPFSVGTGVPSTPATPSTPSAPTASSRPTIRRGERGEHVRHLQERLVAHGHSVDTDGVFGLKTEAQVRAFQWERGLPADGIVGRDTWAALDAEPVAEPSTPSTPSTPATPSGGGGPSSGTRPTLKRGSKGPDVQYLQRLLVDLGYQLTVDGDFGPTTESRVRSFQSDNGLGSDGVVGRKTWEALEAQSSVRSTPASFA